MRYLVIREDGIIAGSITANSLAESWDCRFIGDAVRQRTPEPMVTKAIESPGKKVKLYVIEPLTD